MTKPETIASLDIAQGGADFYEAGGILHVVFRGRIGPELWLSASNTGAALRMPLYGILMNLRNVQVQLDAETMGEACGCLDERARLRLRAPGAYITTEIVLPTMQRHALGQAVRGFYRRAFTDLGEASRWVFSRAQEYRALMPQAPPYVDPAQELLDSVRRKAS